VAIPLHYWDVAATLFHRLSCLGQVVEEEWEKSEGEWYTGIRCQARDARFMEGSEFEYRGGMIS
jgi:hypothetical protein